MRVPTTSLPFFQDSQTAQPQIAVKFGGVYVAWAGVNPSGGGDIFYSSLASGGTTWLSQPVNVSMGSGMATGKQRARASPDRRSEWRRRYRLGTERRLFRAFGERHEFLRPQVRLTASPLAEVGPRIAIDSLGHVFVVWEDADPNYPTSNCPTIWLGRSINAGASFQNYSVERYAHVERRIDGYGMRLGRADSRRTQTIRFGCCGPMTSPIQDLITSHQRQTDSDPTFKGSTRKLSVLAISPNLSGTSSSAPQLAIDASGDIDVVWIGNYLQNGGPGAVYFSRSTNPQDPASFCGGKDYSV